MPFSKCLRAKKYSNMNVYFDPQGCQTLLLKESDPFLFPLGSWTTLLISPLQFPYLLYTVMIFRLFKEINLFDFR